MKVRPEPQELYEAHKIAGGTDHLEGAHVVALSLSVSLFLCLSLSLALSFSRSLLLCRSLSLSLSVSLSLSLALSPSRESFLCSCLASCGRERSPPSSTAGSL